MPEEFDQWDDLLLSGAFAPRGALLSGLTAQQAGELPDCAPHSIYQELWHATMVLEISLANGRVALGSWPWAEHFPAEPEPAGEAEWSELIERFLRASSEAVSRAADDDWLRSPDPGFEEYGLSWRDALEFLAVHTAYHLGRVVLLRQMLGAWPPVKS